MLFRLPTSDKHDDVIQLVFLQGLCERWHLEPWVAGGDELSQVGVPEGCAVSVAATDVPTTSSSEGPGGPGVTEVERSVPQAEAVRQAAARAENNPGYRCDISISRASTSGEAATL